MSANGAFRQRESRWLACVVGLLALFQFGAIGQALAVADGPDFFRVTGVAANDVLNIRSEPSGDAGKIGEIPPGAGGVRNLGCQGGLSIDQWAAANEAQREAARHDRWCRIEFGGVEGWVAGRFLVEGEGSGELWSVVGVAENDKLNVRVAASGDARIVGTLSPYQKDVERLGCTAAEGSSTQWCRIRAGGIEGWVAARFLTRQ